MNDNNDSKTISFDPVDSSDYQKSQPATPKQKLVMSIFIVIILILLSFVILIFGQIFSNASNGGGGGGQTVDQNIIQVYKDPQDVHVGNLLLVNDTFSYVYPTSNDNIVSVYDFKKNSANDAATKITVGEKKYPTYELGSLATYILLDKTTLDSFNQMLLDYCKTLDLTGLADDENASNLNIAWGYSNEDEIESDKTSQIGRAHV